jgi:hypothetical protein
MFAVSSLFFFPFVCKWERRTRRVRIGQKEDDDGDAGKQKRRAADEEGRRKREQKGMMCRSDKE